MILDDWLDGELTCITFDTVSRALNELGEEADKVTHLAQQEAHWDAYTRLTTCIAFLNMASQQQPNTQPKIIRRLLAWIQQMKSVIDKIVKGIGGNGYSIGVSAPFGVSISISFTV